MRTTDGRTPRRRRPGTTPVDAEDRSADGVATADGTFPLEVTGVTKRYRGRTVVDDLTFTVRPGRVTGFLGPNGSGKTTTMKIVLGLAAADRGRATIAGVCYAELPDPARTVGAVLEPDAFHPGRSGRDHLLVLADAIGIGPERVAELLDRVGLDGGAARRRVGTYSLGMKQRLSFAGALLGDPPVLILDEPANGLDPAGIRDLRDLLRGRATQGHTVLVSSHLLTEVEHLVDDVVVIHQGRLVTVGTIDELTRGASLVRTPAADQLEAVLGDQGAGVEHDPTGALVVTGPTLEEIGRAAHRAGIPIYELSARTGSLEDLFFRWTTPADGGGDP
jgi:ABC-2 type transport system ATP-binding protein